MYYYNKFFTKSLYRHFRACKSTMAVNGHHHKQIQYHNLCFDYHSNKTKIRKLSRQIYKNCPECKVTRCATLTGKCCFKIGITVSGDGNKLGAPSKNNLAAITPN